MEAAATTCPVTAMVSTATEKVTLRGKGWAACRPSVRRSTLLRLRRHQYTLRTSTNSSPRSPLVRTSTRSPLESRTSISYGPATLPLNVPVELNTAQTGLVDRTPPNRITQTLPSKWVRNVGAGAPRLPSRMAETNRDRASCRRSDRAEAPGFRPGRVARRASATALRCRTPVRRFEAPMAGLPSWAELHQRNCKLMNGQRNTRSRSCLSAFTLPRLNSRGCRRAAKAYGCAVTRRYGFLVLKPGNRTFASSSDTAPVMITSSPCFQSAGVATWWVAVS